MPAADVKRERRAGVSRSVRGKAGRACRQQAGGSSRVDDFAQDPLTVLGVERRDDDEVDAHPEDPFQVFFDVHNLPADGREELNEYVNIARIRLLAAHVGSEKIQALDVEVRAQQWQCVPQCLFYLGSGFHGMRYFTSKLGGLDHMSSVGDRRSNGGTDSWRRHCRVTTFVSRWITCV
jgi:hypothetical protein